MTKLLSYKEAAELLGVSVVSLKRYVGRGVIPTIRFSKRMVRVPLDKLETMMENGGLNVKRQGA
jgi:excisionase family DNA binding protein